MKLSHLQEAGFVNDIAPWTMCSSASVELLVTGGEGITVNLTGIGKNKLKVLY